MDNCINCRDFETLLNRTMHEYDVAMTARSAALSSAQLGAFKHAEDRAAAAQQLAGEIRHNWERHRAQHP